MYIIAGPNGAGKTTASFAILPEMFMCEEFVNADEVAEGGHHIPTEVIVRRFKHGLHNFFHRYVPVVDQWMLVDNSSDPFRLIAHGDAANSFVLEGQTWNLLKSHSHAS